MALQIYKYINDKDDAFLERSSYSREEVEEGILRRDAYITYRYRYDMPSAFVNAGRKDDVSKEKYESKGASAGGDGDQSMAGAEFSF